MTVEEIRSDFSLAVLGAGAMATALVKGWLAAGLIQPQRIVAADISAARRAVMKDMGIQAVDKAVTAAQSAQVALLATKPQQIPTLLQEIKGCLQPDALVISIAAGITLQQLEQGLGDGCAVVRVMPNTPCLVNTAAVGISIGRYVTPSQTELVERLFQAVGLAFVLPEPLLNAVTGLSGSGPAYVYLAIEALSDGGVAAGLPRDIATKLAAQTVIGAARMVIETGTHPAVLREMVTSPAGTTAAGLLQLEQAGVRAALTQAVLSAAARAEELGNSRA
jgi:pyrroline-5-carboxylate reductase